MDKHKKRLLKSQALAALQTSSEVIDHIIEYIIETNKKNPIRGSTPFDYAKEAIRRQGIEEGLISFRQELTSYAEKE